MDKLVQNLSHFQTPIYFDSDGSKNQTPNPRRKITDKEREQRKKAKKTAANSKRKNRK